MKPWLLALATGCVIAATLWLGYGRAREDQPATLRVAAPEFEGIEAWINSKPKTWQDLRGQVVVLHFWTFG
jgi:hypothetical protein